MQGQLIEPQSKEKDHKVDVKAMLAEMNQEQDVKEKEITQKLSKLDQKLKDIPAKYDKPYEPKPVKSYAQLDRENRQDMSPPVQEKMITHMQAVEQPHAQKSMTPQV